MENVFHYSNSFEKDLSKLSKVDKTRVQTTINFATTLFTTDNKGFAKLIHKTRIVLANGYEPSLYVIRASLKLRICLTIDDDPLFDQRIITLLRIAKSPDEYSKIFKSIAESLYQNYLLDYQE